VIIVVTAVVGLVVVRHQPRNPIGWLLAGEANESRVHLGKGTLTWPDARVLAVPPVRERWAR
jgi:hypothetical protein